MQYKLNRMIQLNAEFGVWRKGNISKYEFSQIEFEPAEMYLIEQKLKEFIETEFRVSCELEARHYVDKYFARFVKLLKKERARLFPGKRILTYGFVCSIGCDDYEWKIHTIKIHVATNTLLIF
jgi:hypothetical protein